MHYVFHDFGQVNTDEEEHPVVGYSEQVAVLDQTREGRVGIPT